MVAFAEFPVTDGGSKADETPGAALCQLLTHTRHFVLAVRVPFGKSVMGRELGEVYTHLRH
jgi:hypothetical protein